MWQTAVAVVRLCQVRQMLVAWPAQMRLSQPGGCGDGWEPGWEAAAWRGGGESCELGPSVAISCLCDPEPRFPYL